MDHAVYVFALLHYQGLRRPRRFASLNLNNAQVLRANGIHVKWTSPVLSSGALGFPRHHGPTTGDASAQISRMSRVAASAASALPRELAYPRGSRAQS